MKIRVRATKRYSGVTGVLSVTVGLFAVGTLLAPRPAAAGKYLCSLVKLPPIGKSMRPEDFIKSFTLDTADVPANVTTIYKGLHVSVHSDGKVTTMKLSDGKRQSVVSAAANAPEVRAHIAETAEAYCISRNVLDHAIPVVEETKR